MYSIHDLRKKLEAVADDLDLVLKVLDVVLIDQTCRSAVINHRSVLKAYNKMVMTGRIDELTYVSEVAKIRARILEEIIDQFLIEKEDEVDAEDRIVAENWNDLPIIKAFFKEDEVLELTSEELNDNTFNSLEGEAALHEDIHEPGDSIPKDEARRFKKLMSNIQDEIRLGEPTAYQKCKEAAEIIHDSAQVFELLMLAFLNQETSERIIENALNGNAKSLKQLEVYVDRIEKYNKAKLAYKTKTDKFTRKHVAISLLKELVKKYKAIPYDYSRDAAVDKTIKEQQERTKVKSIIDISFFIYNKLYPTTFFMDTLQLELVGAGKFSWKSNDFNIEAKWHEAMEISKKSSETNSIQNNPKKLVDLTYSRLKNKFANIKPYYLIIEKQREALPNYYLRMTQIIRSLKLAYNVTGKQEKKFLELALDELTGNKNNGKLRWFHLSLDGDLINHDQVPKDFVAPEVLNEFAELVDYPQEDVRKILLVQKEVVASLINQKDKEERLINYIKAVNVNDKIISQIAPEDKKFLPLLKQSIKFIEECWKQLYGQGDVRITYTIIKDKAVPDPEKLKSYQTTRDIVGIIRTLIEKTTAIKNKAHEIGQAELLENTIFFDETTSGISVNEFIWKQIFIKIKNTFDTPTNNAKMDTTTDLKKQVSRLLKLLQLKSIIEKHSKKESLISPILEEIEIFMKDDGVKNLVSNSSESFYLYDQYYMFPSEKLGYKQYHALKQYYPTFF